MIYQVACSIIIAFLFFLQSGGGKYLGFPRLKIVYTLLGSLVAGLSAFFLYAVSWPLSIAAAVVWYAIMDLARAPAFLGPSQHFNFKSRKGDFIVKLLNLIFKKYDGDVMGRPYWLLWNTFRWVVPFTVLGFLLGNTIVGAIAGALVPVVYTVLSPLFVKNVDMSYEGSDGLEHIGAAFASLPFWTLLWLI